MSSTAGSLWPGFHHPWVGPTNITMFNHDVDEKDWLDHNQVWGPRNTREWRLLRESLSGSSPSKCPLCWNGSVREGGWGWCHPNPFHKGSFSNFTEGRLHLSLGTSALGTNSPGWKTKAPFKAWGLCCDNKSLYSLVNDPPVGQRGSDSSSLSTETATPN